MSKSIPRHTERALEQRQKRDFCNDCERYKAFCSGRRIWFENDEHWVCERYIKAGRLEQEDESEQQSIFQFISSGDGE